MNILTLIDIIKKNFSSPAGLEPALPKGNGLAGHRVNHSAKVTISINLCNNFYKL
ncbi:hypothetical protein U3516DRAFT_770222 [Neocallimastix sp. 'constans']